MLKYDYERDDMKPIQVNDLHKTYLQGRLSTKVLKGLSFSLDEGEFVSLVGPSGSGKTTLLHVLGGFEDYDGSVELFGKELKTYTETEKARLRAHDIGFVFQFYNLIPNLTAYENILLASVLGKHKTKDDIMAVLAMVGMEAFAHYHPGRLSGGMQQRVAIARCLINEPKIIFADEPTGNLDYKNGLAIMDLFKTLNIEHKKTILMVSHNEETTRYGTRVLHLLDGKVIKDERLAI